MSRRGLLAAGALFAGAPALARAAPAAPASPAAFLAYEARLRSRLQDAGGGAFDTDFAQALLAGANAFRTPQGLAAYRWDEGLAACARAHAADMASRAYFAHEAPEGFTHLDRVSLLTRDLCGKTAENLARGDQATPRQFQSMWEASPGHRRNLAHGAYTRAGYGVVRTRAGVYAAGVYADASVRLSRPLPLRLADPADLAAALDGASPHIERVSLTAPFQNPTWSAAPGGQMPRLAAGVWQLRPLRPAGSHRYDVLTGPMFFVG